MLLQIQSIDMIIELVHSLYFMMIDEEWTNQLCCWSCFIRYFWSR